MNSFDRIGELESHLATGAAGTNDIDASANLPQKSTYEAEAGRSLAGLVGIKSRSIVLHDEKDGVLLFVKVNADLRARVSVAAALCGIR
jgi:hypothetical protein